MAFPAWLDSECGSVAWWRREDWRADKFGGWRRLDGDEEGVGLRCDDGKDPKERRL